MRDILMITSEATPFAKTGGLADVIGSLPQALSAQGDKVGVIMPLYGIVKRTYGNDLKAITSYDVALGARTQPCTLYRYVHDGIVFYFVENEHYFGGDEIYHYYDKDIERFAFFTRAVMESIPFLDTVPDVLHCHDWQTGMIPLLMAYEYRSRPEYKNIRTVYSIHNLQYQGIYPKEVVADFLDIPLEAMTPDKAGFFEQVNFMKAGIVFADKVTTVSESYATEIKYPFYGENLDTLLRENEDKLSGILNGIDYDGYNPEKDTAIYQRYSVDNVIDGKAQNKRSLQAELGLTQDENIPMLAIVSRLTSQKGLDLVDYVMEELLLSEMQFVVLGTGEENYEEMFRHYAAKYPTRVSANIKFSDALARKIYAAADIFIMPSLFEPCGIGQMIAARYGTVPVVREVGGLKDTIDSYNKELGTGNGFTFTNYNAHDMLYTVQRALRLYGKKEHWNQVVKNAMNSNFSWDISAKKYSDLYHSITQ